MTRRRFSAALATAVALALPTAAQAAPLTLSTQPAGLQVTVNGEAGTSPFTRDLPEGPLVDVSAPSPQFLGQDRYHFLSWSNGAPAEHSLVLSGPYAITATFAAEPRATTLPTVRGTAKVGRTLSTTQGSWAGTAPIALSYGWMRCEDVRGRVCSTIPGATGRSYTITGGDRGRTLRSQITATNPAPVPSTALSAPTALVPTAAAR